MTCNNDKPKGSALNCQGKQLYAYLIYDGWQNGQRWTLNNKSRQRNLQPFFTSDHVLDIIKLSFWSVVKFLLIFP